MKFRNLTIRALSAFGLATALVGGGSVVAFAQGHMGMANMSRDEQSAHHEKMAGMHTTMAACLKSTKTVDECHQEMKKSCETLHGGKCPMAMKDGHMGGRGMMGGKGGMGAMGGKSGAAGNGGSPAAGADKGGVDENAAPHAPAK